MIAPEEKENRDPTMPPITPSSDLEKDPFQILVQSSSDDERISALCDILQISKSSANITGVDFAKLFKVGTPVLDIADEHTKHQIMTEVEKCVEEGKKLLRREAFHFLILFKTNNGEKASTSVCLSEFLNCIQIWIFRYEGGRVYQELSDYETRRMNPLMFCAISSPPKVMLFLLQHGARFIDELKTIGTKDLSSRVQCIRVLVSEILNDVLESKLMDWECENGIRLKTEFSNLPEKTKMMWWKLRFLMRSVPNPYVTTMKLLGNDQLDNANEYMRILSQFYDALFPDLGFGRSKPPLLLHACRCVIRQRMHENWQLPDGIHQLEVPKILHDYLNLMDD